MKRGFSPALAVLALFLSASVLLAGCAQGGYGGPSGGSQNGQMVFTVADAAADMGAVSRVDMTIDQVEVHSATEGWATVSSSPKTYDLMELRASGSQKLLAEANLKEGAYDQVRMRVQSVTVTDASGTHQARMPSGELRFMGNFEVKGNETAVVKFDFLADKSLHMTGNGEYVMAPVVRVEHRSNAQVRSEAMGNLQVTGGSVKSDSEYGMDAEGKFGLGLSIPASAQISIGSGGIISIGGSGSGGLGVGIGAQGGAYGSGSAGAEGGMQGEGSMQGSDGSGASGNSQGSAQGGASGSAGASGNTGASAETDEDLAARMRLGMN